MPRNLGRTANWPRVATLPAPFTAQEGDVILWNRIPWMHDGLIWRPIPEEGGANYWQGVYAAFPGGTSLTGRGISLSVTGTTTAYAAANTNRIAAIPAVEALVTTASETAVAGLRMGTRALRLGRIDGVGLLYVRMLVRNATGGATATTRGFFGLRHSTSAPTEIGRAHV